MRIQYTCGHYDDFTIHKDGLELIRTKIKCPKCSHGVIKIHHIGPFTLRIRFTAGVAELADATDLKSES